MSGDPATGEWRRLARFLFEGAMLKRTWRTGYAFLGQGRESVAAHSFGMALIGWMLARRHGGADAARVIQLCLVHDLPEARTGDANAVHKRYVTLDEAAAVADMTRDLPGGGEIADLLAEWRAGETVEAALARDADQLDMLLSLKVHLDTGSPDAGRWIPHVRARLRTETGRALARAILEENWASWWMEELLAGGAGGASPPPGDESGGSG
ncbi:HD domain-containing protein [Dissulfurirhabdus thermomarina]|uniref:5'-deoxynucleotidase n=1 Tax=Dissulfurirhabdus thermomarina TaxID=1765737 RepID=A0A6N9TV66_DISTH|nr:HD domain-containing protein [Dissulfurirhabdus thermomarina]NDY43624.1 HD domain-containing protein [Dissulfurirhabdus thermomarina]NMX22854.1 HD domain-containing protein [Dissulfurirhabdus thermomarina]